MILLDTHAAIWFVMGGVDLGRRSRSTALAALARDQLFISAISFWEIGLLVAKGRLRAVRSASEQREKTLSGGIRELPLTGDIALRAVDLAELPGDPADRFIVATAITHNAILMTADERLLGWRHGLTRQDAAK